MNLDDLNCDFSDILLSENGCQYTDIDDGIINAPSRKTNSLNMLHLNIRSFQRNKDALTMLLADLQEKGIVVHVIGLCKTFLTDHTSSNAELENYRSLH